MKYFFTVTLVYVLNFSFLMGMEMKENVDIENSSKDTHIVSCLNEHKEICDFLSRSFLIGIVSIRPFLEKNIAELQEHKPKKYRLLKKLMRYQKNNFLDSKKDDKIAKLNSSVQKIGSKILINSLNGYIEDCDKIRSTNSLVSRLGVGVLVTELVFTICLFVGVLSPILSKCY